jgi:pyruvate/2-oxoglutarate dehydrogenase complex dihydrolipoamide acyltransferase (E2) component
MGEKVARLLASVTDKLRLPHPLMSKIAEALAKAKERTGTTTAPFVTGHQAANPAPARAFQDNNRLWLAILSLVFLGIAGVIWMQLKPVALPEEVVAPAPTEITATAPVVPAPPAAPPAPTPRADLVTVVNGLVISAVLPGERPRLMMDGRIIQPDESVDPELVFAGVQDGHVLFRDARGAVYSRKY